MVPKSNQSVGLSGGWYDNSDGQPEVVGIREQVCLESQCELNCNWFIDGRQSLYTHNSLA